MIKKKDWYPNNPEKSSTTKATEYIPCRYSISTIWTFDNTENKQTSYRWEDCVKNFCVSLKKHATNVINFEMKKNLLLKWCKADLMFSVKHPDVSLTQSI